MSEAVLEVLIDLCLDEISVLLALDLGLRITNSLVVDGGKRDLCLEGGVDTLELKIDEFLIIKVFVEIFLKFGQIVALIPIIDAIGVQESPDLNFSEL
jgi:hypothetical protein